MDTRSIRAELAGRSQPPGGAKTAAVASPARSGHLQRPKLLSGLVRRFRSPGKWVRSHPRHSCCIVGVLVILGRNVPIDGLVTEISIGGALFRPASDFIFDRGGEEVALRFAEREWRGRIVNVRRRGYGINLAGEVSEDEVQDIITRFGLGVALQDD
jgi:hypothetical protein